MEIASNIFILNLLFENSFIVNNYGDEELQDGTAEGNYNFHDLDYFPPLPDYPINDRIIIK